jgi:hydrophobe/amphiphile efflux-1 (HAE1) family protein
VVQLPDAASFERTDAVVKHVDELARSVSGVAHTFAVSGYSNVLQTNQPNLGAAFIIPESFEQRHGDPTKTAAALMASLKQKFSGIQEARVLVLPPPPLRGLGNSGGFKLMIQDLNNAGPAGLQKAVSSLMDELGKDADFNSLLPGFRANVPQYFMDIDRRQAKSMGVSVTDLNETLQVFLGGVYINDFNLFGRTYQVTAQAEPHFRATPESISHLRTRNASGGMVPLASLVKLQPIAGADRFQRYNMYPSGDLSGNISANLSSGEMIRRVQAAADRALPPGYAFEWTDLTYQQILAGDSLLWIFPLCVMLVFLVLAALYESWGLPLAVILIVPMCLLSALSGVWASQMDNNIFTQIGLIVLVGLAAKNAILIVEFARQAEERGLDRFEAAVEACKLRLRPILMTSFAFILGVVPLVRATGAGSEMRRTLGATVFYGMIGVTLFGLIFTPVFYVVIRKYGKRS